MLYEATETIAPKAPMPTLKSVEAMSANALIVEIATSRSREAYRVLFLRFSGKVKSFLLSKGVYDGLAEDMAQDALLTVWRRAESFDPTKAQASTWIYTIARNLYIDHLRKDGRNASRADLYGVETELLAEPPEPPQDAVLRTEAEKAVRHAFSLLPTDQGELVRLSYFEELSHSQISQKLNLPLGTVKSRLRLALERLKQAFTAHTERK